MGISVMFGQKRHLTWHVINQCQVRVATKVRHMFFFLKKNFNRNMINLETGGWNVTVNMSFKIYSTTLGGSRDIHFVMNMKILINVWRKPQHPLKCSVITLVCRQAYSANCNHWMRKYAMKLLDPMVAGAKDHYSKAKA